MTKPGLILYYDGDCPICNAYRNYVAGRSNGELELRNAREHRVEVEDLARQGFDINTGMILVSPRRTLQGCEAVVATQDFTRRRGRVDGLFRFLLKAPWLVRIGYPLARLLRNGLLRITGRTTRVEWKN